MEQSQATVDGHGSRNRFVCGWGWTPPAPTRCSGSNGTGYFHLALRRFPGVISLRPRGLHLCLQGGIYPAEAIAVRLFQFVYVPGPSFCPRLLLVRGCVPNLDRGG